MAKITKQWITNGKWYRAANNKTVQLVDVIFVTDRVTRSQLARPTHLLGFSQKVKSCIAVYIISVLFVLFLLVWCVSGLIYKCSRSGTLDLHLNLDRPSPAKPSQQHGKPARASLDSGGCLRGCWISLLWERGRNEPICSSTIDAIAAQVHCNK
jgi:hypothetical protein